MKWCLTKNFEYLGTGSSMNRNLSVLTGTDVVRTIGIFEILICGGGGATEMVHTKFEYFCTGSGTDENFSVLTGTNEVQTIYIFEILICMCGGASEMVPQKEF